MEAPVDRLSVGMDVDSSDGQRLGSIIRIWWPDGHTEPQGQSTELVEIQEADGETSPMAGYFQVDRFLAPDWYIPFSAVGGVLGDRIVLNVTESDGERFAWQERPDESARTH
jgi:hypothetical protein